MFMCMIFQRFRAIKQLFVGYEPFDELSTRQNVTRWR